MPWRSLSASRARIRGCIDVLRQNIAPEAMESGTGHDRPDTEGGRLSAREVLRAIVTDRHADALIRLVTGSAFWVDDGLWPKIESSLIYPGVWLAITMKSMSSWTTADRVSLVTRLLTSGVTVLLARGTCWARVGIMPVNCVIDLTGIVARHHQPSGPSAAKGSADASGSHRSGCHYRRTGHRRWRTNVGKRNRHAAHARYRCDDLFNGSAVVT